MASTLSFRVEVAADQATQSLQVLSQAFNQAGITAKAALLKVGEGSQGAANASTALEQRVKSLKSEMASGDRTINFFARSLNSIVPEASAAGQGIRLLADGLIGGVGLGFAIQGVMAILALFGESLKEASERERKAAEESKRYAAERLKAYQDADREWRKLQFIRAGGTAAGFDAQEKDKGNADALAQARGALAAAQSEFSKRWRGNVPDEGTMQAQQYADELARIAQLQADVAREVETAAKGVAVGAASMEGAVAKATTAVRAQGAAAQSAAADLRNLAAVQNDVVGFGAGTTRSYMPENTGMITAGQAGNQFLSSFQKDFVRDAENEAKAAGKSIGDSLVEPMVSAWTNGLTSMLTRQQSFAQGVAGIFTGMMQVVVQMATKQILASAAVSGAEAAKSQAGIPVVGPILAISAMSAMLAQVSAMTSKVPSAEGGWWDTGSYEGLAYIHKREMVADAPLANAIRSGNAGGGNTTINVNGNLDGKGVFRTLTASDGDVARAMKRMQRRRRA